MGWPWRGTIYLPLTGPLVGAMLSLAPTEATAAPPAVGRTRVAVVEPQVVGVPASEAGDLSNDIARQITKHPTYELISDDEVDRAVTAHEGGHGRCAVDETCLASVGRAVNADVVVSGSLKKSGAGYMLELSSRPMHGDPPAQASEEMKQLRSVALNVGLCLDRLFKWNDRRVESAASVAAVDGLTPQVFPVESTPTPTPSPASTPSSVQPVMPLPTAPAVTDARRKLALIAVTTGDGVSANQSRTIEETLLAALDATGRFKVVGRSDIDALLSLEAKRESAGCVDTGCMVQIAGALGVDFVSTADVGRLGKNMLITVKVIEVRSAAVVARAQVKAASDDVLPDAAQEVAEKLVRELWPSSPQSAPPPPAISPQPAPPSPSLVKASVQPAPTLSPPAPRPVFAEAPASAAGKPNGAFVATWVMLGVGAAAAVVASVAGATGQKCPQHPETPPGVASAYACEATYSTTANVGWAVAGASALTSGILLFTWIGKGGSPESGRVAVSPTSAAVTGTF